MIIIEAQYKRYADNLYWNHGHTLILNIIFQAVEKEKEFFGIAVGKFACIFKKQTVKIVNAIEI